MGNKDDQLIMVVREEDLFRLDLPKERSRYFTGFSSIALFDYSEVIQKDFGFVTRKFAEQDSSYKQPIPYGVVINRISGKVLSYQRSSKDEEYTEKRLQGKISIGVGGHIEQKDLQDFGLNFIFGAMNRELEEEVETTDGKPIEVSKMSRIGHLYLNYDVHAVHFGIVYAIETVQENLGAKDSEAKKARFVDIDELEKLCLDSNVEVEDWSKILVDPVKDYIKTISN